MKKTRSKPTIKNAIFYLLTALLVGFIVLQLVAPSHTIKLLGFRSFAVVSDSMEPVYNIGDIIIVKPVNLDDLKADDVITFKVDLNNDGVKETVTHYIYSIETVDNERIFKTNPHGVNNPDPWSVSDEDIIGLVSSKISYIGYVIIFFQILFQNPIFLGLIVLNIVIIVTIVMLLKKSKKE